MRLSWFTGFSVYHAMERLSHHVHVLIYSIKFYSLRVRNKVLVCIKFNLLQDFFSLFFFFFFLWNLLILVALSQSTDHSLVTFTHTFMHWWQRLPRKVPTAHQEQFGVQYLAQGCFDMQPGGARDSSQRPSECWTTRSASWAAAKEPKKPFYFDFFEAHCFVNKLPESQSFPSP